MNDIYKILNEQKKCKLKGGLYHNVQIKFAYNTNRIEGSGLSEDETRQIFETNTIAQKDEFVKVDDIIETTNHFFLFDYMLDHTFDDLSEQLLKELHKLLKRGTSYERIDWFNVGEYKQLPNEVGGIITTAPDKVESEMQSLLGYYNSLCKIDLEDIIDFHYKFERIHPFQDGNGRVGRIVMFKECLKNDITPFIIDEKHKLFYYRGLKEYGNEKGWLTDTIKSSQDDFINLYQRFIKFHI